MIVSPKIRGFICTTAHPTGCSNNVAEQAEYAKIHPNSNIPKNVLVIGASTGYGLACRIAAAFGGTSDTVGVFFEKNGSEKRTGTAGYYNNLAFEAFAAQAGRKYASINGDAFSDETKAETIAAIKNTLNGKVDLIVYSLAAPKRKAPNGITYSSVIQPIGQNYCSKSVNFHTGEVTQVEIPAATEEEIAGTVAVMGGEDWLLWIKTLQEADLLAENVCTLAFSYIGPKLTHAIYKDGTIGRAKLDLEKKAAEINSLLAPLHGKAFVSVNKALVTQASSAIPVVPLYISMLYKQMKQAGTHEDCIHQAVRLLERLYPTTTSDWNTIPTDEDGRLRLDDWEMRPEIQNTIEQEWPYVTTETMDEFADLQGYRDEFLKLFGFGRSDVDYSQDVEVNR